MATVNGKSGTFAIYTKNSNINGYVKWTETYDNATYINTNKTTVKLEMYLHRVNIYNAPISISASGVRNAYFGADYISDTSKLNITIPANTSANGGAYVKVFEASKDITHNSDGNKTLDVGFYMNNDLSESVGEAFRVPKTLSNITLTKIPKRAVITHALSSVTETSARIKWTSDSTIDYIWYSIDNGGTFTGIDIEDATSGVYEIKGLKANKTYNIKTRARRKDSQLDTTVGTLAVTTYDYPHCTSAPNFTIGEALTLKLYNPLKRLVTISFISNGTQLSSDETALETVTGWNSSSFTTKLYNSIPNQLSAVYSIKVIYEDSVRTTSGSKYTVNVEECKPSFSKFSYYDSNEVVAAITGNDTAIVKGKSNLMVLIDNYSNMACSHGANPSHYTAVIDDISVTVEPVSYTRIDLSRVNSAGSKRLTVTAYDTRGLSASVYQDINVYDYTKPVINVEAARVNSFDADTRLKISGTYEPLNIAGVDKNTISSVQYRYRAVGGDWSSWSTAKTTLSAGKYTCNDLILTLDPANEFEIEVKVSDKLDSNTATLSVGAGESIFFISTNKKACYINGQEILTYNVLGEW